MSYANFSAIGVLMCVPFTSLISGCAGEARLQSPTNVTSQQEVVQAFTEGVYRPLPEEAKELRRLIGQFRETEKGEVDEAELRTALRDAARECHKAVVWYVMWRMVHAKIGSQEELHKIVSESATKAKCPDVLDLTEYPDCFVLPRNFDSLVFYPDSYGGRHVAYIATDPFPARHLIGFIRSQLARKGWKSICVERPSAESGGPDVQDWAKFVDRTSGKTRDAVWVWRAQWVDQRGNRVEYMCAYRESYSSDRDALLALDKEPTTDSVSVVASWTPSP